MNPSKPIRIVNKLTEIIHKSKKRIIRTKVLHEFTPLIEIIEFFLKKILFYLLIILRFKDEFAQFVVKVYIRIDERNECVYEIIERDSD